MILKGFSWNVWAISLSSLNLRADRRSEINVGGVGSIRIGSFSFWSMSNWVSLIEMLLTASVFLGAGVCEVEDMESRPSFRFRFVGSARLVGQSTGFWTGLSLPVPVECLVWALARLLGWPPPFLGVFTVPRIAK